MHQLSKLKTFRLDFFLLMGQVSFYQVYGIVPLVRERLVGVDMVKLESNETKLHSVVHELMWLGPSNRIMKGRRKKEPIRFERRTQRESWSWSDYKI